MTEGTDDATLLGVPFPLEVVIRATPVSDQASNRGNRARWIEEVRRKVQERIYQIVDWYQIENKPLMATIFYFPNSAMEGDLDNIVKPIIDGMIGPAYLNDRHIEKIVVQKFEPEVAWLFSAPTPMLARAIEVAKPALYIRLDSHLAWRSVR